MTGFLRPSDFDNIRIQSWRNRYSKTDDEHLRFLSYSLPPLETSAAPNAQIALRQIVEERKLTPMTSDEYWKYIAKKFK